MKWVLSQQSLDHHRWLLQDAQQAQFTYNLQSHSIRIKGKSNRLFFLELAGVFQKKILLRSEYGIVVGEAQWTPAKDPFLVINGQKFHFQFADQQLSLFDKHKNLLTTVELETPLQADRKELFALLFSSAWVIASEWDNRRTENLLVA